jgi:hypothetical protein
VNAAGYRAEDYPGGPGWPDSLPEVPPPRLGGQAIDWTAYPGRPG